MSRSFEPTDDLDRVRRYVADALVKNTMMGYSTVAERVSSGAGAGGGTMMRAEGAKAEEPKTDGGHGGYTGAPRKTAPEGYPKDKGRYADPENMKYPVDTPEHARAALAYFSMPKNQAKYPPAKRAAILGRIKAAAKKHGIEVSSDRDKEKSMETWADLAKGVMGRDVKTALKALSSSAGPEATATNLDYTGEGSASFADKPPPTAAGGATAMVDHPRPGDGPSGEHAFERTMAEVEAGDGFDAESSTPMVDHPRPDASDNAPDPTLGMADSEFSRADGEPMGLEGHGAARNERLAGGGPRAIKAFLANQKKEREVAEKAARAAKAAKAAAVANPGHHGGHGMGGSYRGLIHGERAEEEQRDLDKAAGAGASGAFADEQGRAEARTTAGLDDPPPAADMRRTPGLDEWGLPIVEDPPEIQLSEDDQPIDSQIVQYQPHDIERRAKGAGIAKSVRLIRAAVDAQGKALIASGMGIPLGLGVAPRRRIAALGAGGAGDELQKAQKADGAQGAQGRGGAQDRGRTYQHGVVQYSDREDVMIAKAMERADGLYAPVMNTQSTLMKSRVCPSCRSVVPIMFSSCPECGVDGNAVLEFVAMEQMRDGLEKAGYNVGPSSLAGPGAIVQDPSIDDAVRGPTHHETYHPGGRIPL